MGKASFSMDEIRIDVRDPQVTHIYIFCVGFGDIPFFVNGWHHKAFPARMTTVEILEKYLGECASWPLLAPPNYQNLGNYASG